mmetsp:Transcript_5562/g.15555  ORF Transcript_5562/g.15555 Transcript_5562/m.15555 type:complete len:248 (-) Transcript_5562:583-1326(-)
MVKRSSPGASLFVHGTHASRRTNWFSAEMGMKTMTSGAHTQRNMARTQSIVPGCSSTAWCDFISAISLMESRPMMKMTMMAKVAIAAMPKAKIATVRPSMTPARDAPTQNTKKMATMKPPMNLTSFLAASPRSWTRLRMAWLRPARYNSTSTLKSGCTQRMKAPRQSSSSAPSSSVEASPSSSRHPMFLAYFCCRSGPHCRPMMNTHAIHATKMHAATMVAGSPTNWKNTGNDGYGSQVVKMCLDTR